MLWYFTISVLSSKGLFTAGSLSAFVATWLQVFLPHSPSSFFAAPGLLEKPVSSALSVSPCLSRKRLVGLGLDLVPVWPSCRSSSWVEPVCCLACREVVLSWWCSGWQGPADASDLRSPSRAECGVCHLWLLNGPVTSLGVDKWRLSCSNFTSELMTGIILFNEFYLIGFELNMGR